MNSLSLVTEPRLEQLAVPAPTVLATEALHMVFPMGGGNVQALRGLDLEIRRGEFVCIMGSSGCGKSTLLHILGGLLTPTAGRVLVDGEELSGMSDAGRTELRRRKLGFVFQRFNLFPTLTAEANLRLAQWVTTGSRRDTEGLCKRRFDLLDQVGLESKARHRPHQLSGGEQQRVAIARSLLNEPVILLADEPTGNLDSVNSTRILDTFRELNTNLGQTIVMITHDREAAHYASRVLNMKDGKIHA